MTDQTANHPLSTFAEASRYAVVFQARKSFQADSIPQLHDENDLCLLLLAFHHFADQCFIIKGLLTAWYAALKQSVISLCIK